MTTWPSPPPTRILSWSQMVREADPNYTKLSLQPWIFEFSNGRLFVDWMPLYSDTTVAGLSDVGGVLHVDPGFGWPVSSSGLVAGDLWSDAGVARCVGPTSPYAGAQPVFLDQTGAAALLMLGGADLPLLAPRAADQIWNDGGTLKVTG